MLRKVSVAIMCLMLAGCVVDPAPYHDYAYPSYGYAGPVIETPPVIVGGFGWHRGWHDGWHGGHVFRGRGAWHNR